ncbi:MAG TPA: VOC family protein [Solirubrobacteraceae bacterium]|nr:VOC family protein [Solirubrobacteraceae bacterium]
MSDLTQVPTTVSNIGTVMFSVADMDAAIAFYTERLGFELRADVAFGEGGAHRWVEVAPPGSVARIAFVPPGDQPGGSAIGVETHDIVGEHARLAALGLEVGPPPTDAMPGAPRLFPVADPDGNHVWIVELPPTDD